MPIDPYTRDWWRRILGQQVQTAEPFDPEGEGYDIGTAQKFEMQRDISGHMGSVVPVLPEELKNLGLPAGSYLMLKGKKHKTWPLAVEAEEKRGYEIIKRNGRYYSILKK